MGKFSSLVVDGNTAHVAYYDAINKDLKYTRYQIDPPAPILPYPETVVATGDVGAYCSLALDSSGNPRISYQDRTTNYRLMFIKYESGAWQAPQTVDDGGLSGDYLGYYTSLAVDANNRAHISYYDDTNNVLKYAYWNGSKWVIEVVDNNGDVGMFSSLALERDPLQTNGIAEPPVPHISYYDNTFHRLKHADRAGGTWAPNIETVDTHFHTGTFSSLALDSDNNPHIAYFESDLVSFLRSLRYAYWDPDTSTWVIEDDVDADDTGSYCSLALDPDDHPYIAYYDAKSDYLSFAYNNGTGWHYERYGDIQDQITGERTNGIYNSIAVDDERRAVISHYDPDMHNLKLAIQTPPPLIVASAGPNGSISPEGDVYVNYGANQTFTFTPDEGYEVDEVLICSGGPPSCAPYTSVSFSNNQYTFFSVTNERYEIQVTFKDGHLHDYDERRSQRVHLPGRPGHGQPRSG